LSAKTFQMQIVIYFLNKTCQLCHISKNFIGGGKIYFKNKQP